MTKKTKLIAVIWKLSRIPLQERRVLDIDIDEALAEISDELLELFYQKIVREI